MLLALALGSGLWLALGGGDRAVCVGHAPFTVTLSIEGVAFSHTALALPPGVEVALTLDSRDEGLTHNIVFYGGDPGPYHPEGCFCGCLSDGSRLVSAPVTGIGRHTFTFVSPPPGHYSFWCDYHPDTMVGELVVVE